MGSASLVQTGLEFRINNSKRVRLLANCFMTVLRFCPVPYKKRSNRSELMVVATSTEPCRIMKGGTSTHSTSWQRPLSGDETSSIPFSDMHGCGRVVACIPRVIPRSIVRPQLHCSHRRRLNGRTLTLKWHPSRWNPCYYRPQPCQPPFMSSPCKRCHGNLKPWVSADSDYPSSDNVLSNHNSPGPRNDEDNTPTIK